MKDRMQERRDTGKDGCRTVWMQANDRCRTRGIQDRKDAGKEGCRKGGMKGLRDEGMKGRSDEEKEGFRSRKIQDWRDA